MARTLDQLVIEIARRFGSARAGTATGGSTTTVVDTTLIQPDNYWNNYYVRMLTGSQAGKEALISSYAQSTGTLTINPAMGASIANNDTYQILPLVRQDFVDSIYEAIRIASQSWMQIIDDTTTLAYSSTAQQYSLPADLVSLIGLYVGSADGYWFELNNYEIVGDAGAYKMIMREFPRDSYVASEPSFSKMRLVYLALPDIPAAGSNDTGLSEPIEREALAFVSEYALHILHEQAMSRNVTGESARGHFSLAQQHYNKAKQIQSDRRPQNVVRRVRTIQLPRQIG
jgi:hypothetical protein